MKVGFIGLGNMASAMIGGIIAKGIRRSEDIVGTDCLAAGRDRAQEIYQILVTETNIETVQQADILFLCVKPQFYEEVIKEIRNEIRPDQIIVSIAPGKTIRLIEDLFERQIKLLRCMPNTPALVGEGCTGVCINEQVTQRELDEVMTILSSFGKASTVKEDLMDAVVGVSGSSPAYVFMFIEAMADAAVLAGMPRNMAYEFAAQSVYGSAKMMLETGKHPGVLKDMVCSPAGTTIEAVRILEEKGFRSAVMEAVLGCIDKSKKL